MDVEKFTLEKGYQVFKNLVYDKNSHAPGGSWLFQSMRILYYIAISYLFGRNGRGKVPFLLSFISRAYLGDTQRGVEVALQKLMGKASSEISPAVSRVSQVGCQILTFSKPGCNKKGTSEDWTVPSWQGCSSPWCAESTFHLYIAGNLIRNELRCPICSFQQFSSNGSGSSEDRSKSLSLDCT